MRLYRILKGPIITEKSSTQELKNGTYTIEVSCDATKIDIKKAILEIYGVEVSSVRVLNTREKFKQGRKGMITKRKPFKKAYVTLKDPSKKIDFTVLKA